MFGIWWCACQEDVAISLGGELSFGCCAGRRHLWNSHIPFKSDTGRVPRRGVRIPRRLGRGMFKKSKNQDYKMFCSLLSTFQMSCKSTPCQWSAHVPLLIFRQLSAQLSPGYRDSKFSPCLCCVSPCAPWLRELFSQLLHETCPVCSPAVRIVCLFSSHSPAGCCCSASCGACKSPPAVMIRLCFGGCLVAHAKQIRGL